MVEVILHKLSEGDFTAKRFDSLGDDLFAEIFPQGLAKATLSYFMDKNKLGPFTNMASMTEFYADVDGNLAGIKTAIKDFLLSECNSDGGNFFTEHYKTEKYEQVSAFSTSVVTENGSYVILSDGTGVKVPVLTFEGLAPEVVIDGFANSMADYVLGFLKKELDGNLINMVMVDIDQYHPKHTGAEFRFEMSNRNTGSEDVGVEEFDQVDDLAVGATLETEVPTEESVYIETEAVPLEEVATMIPDEVVAPEVQVEEVPVEEAQAEAPVEEFLEESTATFEEASVEEFPVVETPVMEVPQVPEIPNIPDFPTV